MTTNDNLEKLYKTKEELFKTKEDIIKQLNEINEKIKKEDELEKLQKNNKLKEDIKIICKKFTYHYLQRYNLLMQFYL